jgi:hypothetical protein
MRAMRRVLLALAAAAVLLLSVVYGVAKPGPGWWRALWYVGYSTGWMCVVAAVGLMIGISTDPEDHA